MHSLLNSDLDGQYRRKALRQLSSQTPDSTLSGESSCHAFGQHSCVEAGAQSYTLFLQLRSLYAKKYC